MRRADLIGVHRPKVQFLHAKIASEVAKCAFARHQPTAIFWDFCNGRAQWFDGGAKLFFIGLGIGHICFGVVGVLHNEGVDDVIDVDQRVIQTHPSMRIGLALVAARRNRNGVDSVS